MPIRTSLLGKMALFWQAISAAIIPTRVMTTLRSMTNFLRKLLSGFMAASLWPAFSMRAAADVPKALQPERSSEWWHARHEAKLREVSENGKKIDLVFLGDSITQGLENPGASKIVSGTFPGSTILNLGYNADKTENVLWRLRNGEIDGISPKAVVVMIGTNNTGHRKDPPEVTAQAIKVILDDIKSKLPDSKIVLLSIFPRGANPSDPLRQLNEKVNGQLPTLADGKTIFHLDLNAAFLNENGDLSQAIMPDLLHPSDKGYEVWMKSLKPELEKILTAPSST